MNEPDPADRHSAGPESIVGFYDAWANDYDAAHADWRASVVAQGSLLADALAASVLPSECWTARAASAHRQSVWH